MRALMQHHVLANAALRQRRAFADAALRQSHALRHCHVLADACVPSYNVTCSQTLALRQHHVLHRVQTRRCCAQNNATCSSMLRPENVTRLPMPRSNNVTCLLTCTRRRRPRVHSQTLALKQCHMPSRLRLENAAYSPSGNITFPPMCVSDDVTCSLMLALRQCHVLRRFCAQTTPRVRRCLPSDNDTFFDIAALGQRRLFVNARPQATPRSCQRCAQTKPRAPIRQCCAQRTPRTRRCPPSDNVTRSPMRSLIQRHVLADTALRQRHVLADARSWTTPRAHRCRA